MLVFACMWVKYESGTGEEEKAKELERKRERGVSWSSEKGTRKERYL